MVSWKGIAPARVAEGVLGGAERESQVQKEICELIKINLHSLGDLGTSGCGIFGAAAGCGEGKYLRLVLWDRNEGIWDV